MPQVLVNNPDHPDDPTQIEVDYSEIPEDDLIALAMDGDEGAVEYLNGEDAEAPSPSS